MNMGGNAALIRVYQLRSSSGFERSSLDAFWRSDEAIANDLIGIREEVLLYPDQEHAFDLKLEKDTRFVGIAANLRDPYSNAWREVIEVNRLRGRKVTVRIASDRLEVNVRQ